MNEEKSKRKLSFSEVMFLGFALLVGILLAIITTTPQAKINNNYYMPMVR